MKATWQRFRAWMRGLDPRVKFLLGIFFIALGLLALVTPLTPGSWLVFVGLELIGIRILAWRKISAWLTGRKRTKEEEAEDEEDRL